MTAVTRDASVANDPQRARRLYEAVEASTVGGELTKRVYHLGKPHFTDGVRTACIAVGADEHVLFLFNRNFFDGLAGTPLVFVLLHEALHLALAHHQRQGQRIAAVWNISCDLVVNQFLLHQVGFCMGGLHRHGDHFRESRSRRRSSSQGHDGRAGVWAAAHEPAQAPQAVRASPRL